MCFPRDGECAILIHFPGSLRARPSEKSTDVGPKSLEWAQVRTLVGGWRGDGDVGKILTRNASSLIMWLSFPPCRQCDTIEVYCNQVNFLRNDNGTENEDELLGNAFLSGTNVAHTLRQAP